LIPVVDFGVQCGQEGIHGHVHSDLLSRRYLSAAFLFPSFHIKREYYPGIYRHLLYLTGRRETAEDLTQETFLQAWRCLDTFDPTAFLRPWLHRIAHREFLQALRARRLEIPLESMLEPPDPCSTDLTEAVELRSILDTLPIKEREMVVLHHLEAGPKTGI